VIIPDLVVIASSRTSEVKHCVLTLRLVASTGSQFAQINRGRLLQEAALLSSFDAMALIAAWSPDLRI
jgi:hypothetical protein